MRADGGGRSTSLALLATLLLAQPKTWLTTLAASVHSTFMSSFSATNVFKSFSRAALNPFSAQPALVLGIALIQVQDLALGVVGLNDIYAGPLPKPVKVPLDGILSFQHTEHTTELGIVSKLAESALSPTVRIADKSVERCWLLSQPLRNATCHLDIEPLTAGLECDHPASSLSTA